VVVGGRRRFGGGTATGRLMLHLLNHLSSVLISTIVACHHFERLDGFCCSLLIIICCIQTTLSPQCLVWFGFITIASIQCVPTFSYITNFPPDKLITTYYYDYSNYSCIRLHYFILVAPDSFSDSSFVFRRALQVKILLTIDFYQC